MNSKLNPKCLSDARKRYNNLSSISAELDLGNDLTLKAFGELIEQFQELLDKYNTLKATLDGMRSTLKSMEVHLRDFTEKMLMAVAAKYGKNSEEYVKAGGKKKSDIKRSKKPDIPIIPDKLE